MDTDGRVKVSLGGASLDGYTSQLHDFWCRVPAQDEQDLFNCLAPWSLEQGGWHDVASGYGMRDARCATVSRMLRRGSQRPRGPTAASTYPHMCTLNTLSVSGCTMSFISVFSSRFVSVCFMPRNDVL